MISRDALTQIIQKNSKALHRYGVKEIGIFGSVARGEAKESSDVDILVSFEKGKKTFQNFTKLVDLLESQVGLPVDLMTRESLSPYIGPKILNEVKYVPIAS